MIRQYGAASAEDSAEPKSRCSNAEPQIILKFRTLNALWNAIRRIPSNEWRSDRKYFHDIPNKIGLWNFKLEKFKMFESFEKYGSSESSPVNLWEISEIRRVTREIAFWLFVADSHCYWEILMAIPFWIVSWIELWVCIVLWSSSCVNILNIESTGFLCKSPRDSFTWCGP